VKKQSRERSTNAVGIKKQAALTPLWGVSRTVIDEGGEGDKGIEAVFGIA